MVKGLQANSKITLVPLGISVFSVINTVCGDGSKLSKGRYFYLMLNKEGGTSLLAAYSVRWLYWRYLRYYCTGCGARFSFMCNMAQEYFGLISENVEEVQTCRLSLFLSMLLKNS